jgi:amidohydrolase
MDLDQAKARAQQVIDAISDELRMVSLEIHGHPELNFEEHHAHRVLTDYLEGKGFHVQRGAFEMATAFQAVAGSGTPTVAILCEYDALPGIGHACGHNLIAAAGVAAGVAVKEVLGEGSGTVLVLGSPAEEGGGGKILLIERGAFEGVDAAMMVHPTARDSAYMHVLAVDHINVEYRGRNAHAAAAPWDGVNALDALVVAYTAISAMRQQMRPSDRVHGVITHGGLKPNIIPDFTAAEFYIRARNRAELDDLRRKTMGCFEGAAAATGCELTVSTRPDQRPYSDMVANDTLADLYTGNLATFGITVPSKQQVLSGPGGSTDMGDVSYVVPSIHPMFAIPTEDGNHTPGFTAAAATPEAHAAAMRAAKAMAMTALDIFGRPDVLDAAKAEFARMGQVRAH